MNQDDASWREKHAELHGELQSTLRHMDKNMDELATLIEKNADRRDKSITELILLHNEQVRFRTGCREEMLKDLNTLKTTVATEARLAAKTESKKWGLIIVLISTLLGAAVGVIVTVLTHGAY